MACGTLFLCRAAAAFRTMSSKPGGLVCAGESRGRPSTKINTANGTNHLQAARNLSEPTSEAPLPDSIPAVILSFAEFAELLAAVHEKADERIHGIAEAML